MGMQKPRWPWITIAALQCGQLISLLPWLPMAGLAVMAFDAPGSTENWQPWAFVLGIWSYPLWLLGAGAVTWTLYAFGWVRTALAVAVLFTLPMPALIAAIIIGNASA